TYLKRTAAKHLDESTLSDQTAHQRPVGAKWRDECSECDDPGFHEQLGHLTDAAYVLAAIRFGKTQVATETMADIVAIEDKGAAAQIVEALLQCMRQRRLARAGQTREPDDEGTVAMQAGAHLGRHGARVPVNFC